MRLWELKPGETATVTEISEVPKSVFSKIQNLGIQANEQVKCLQWLPFGGPRVYKLENGVFALEKNLASFVEVKN